MGQPHPVETKARALGLFLDYAGPKEISEILEIPLDTARSWTQTTLTIDGVELKWGEFRDVIEAARAQVSSDRHIKAEKQFEWDSYVAGHKEQVAEQLQKARQFIIDHLHDQNEKGDLQSKPTIASLKGIIESELLLQGKATKIIEERKSMVILLGKAISHAVSVTLKPGQLVTDETSEILLDRVQDSFRRIVASGGEESAIVKKLKR